ncbi:MAG: hypothetical protein K0R57_189 [Paenibacillaceae bacterium]|nr:hypothetical protein [Paenibacillaceae bacterium]
MIPGKENPFSLGQVRKEQETKCSWMKFTEKISVIKDFFGHCRELTEKISVNSLKYRKIWSFQVVWQKIAEKISAKSARNEGFAGITEKISVRSKRGGTAVGRYFLGNVKKGPGGVLPPGFLWFSGFTACRTPASLSPHPASLPRWPRWRDRGRSPPVPGAAVLPHCALLLLPCTSSN